ncbi:MAG: insulinase family protein [Cyclobacteriaceae bacterium]
MIKVIGALSLFFLSLSAVAQTGNLSIERYQLPNGLTVYLNPDNNASNVYGAVWVNAGGKDDPADATGIAHYLEHMLFKGTQSLGTQDYEKEKIHLDSIKMLYDQLATTADSKAKLNIQAKINDQALKAAQFAIPNEFDKLIKSIGSTGVNASTNNDYTNYYNFFPSNQLPKWLDIYAHRFQEPVFRLFQSELEAVYEEKNRAGDNLERRVVQEFDQHIYGDHPYSTQTVLGSVEHLKNPSLSKMYAYFQKYYVPNNMALVLSGNFDAEEAKPLIVNTFGKLKPGEKPEFPTYETNSFDGRELVKVRITPIKAGFMGYKLVPVGHPDRAALQVVGSMMSNENETGFIDELSLNNEVLYAGGYQEFMEDDGSTFIFYVPKLFGKSLKKFEDKIQGSFADITKGNFSDEYFQSIKNGIYRNFNLTTEGLSSRGRYLGLSYVYGMDYNDMLSLPEQIKNLSKEEVQRVAKKYYGENFFTMHSRTGFPKKVKLDKPAYKPIDSRTEASSDYAKTFEALPEGKSNPTFIDLQNDLTVTDDYIYYTANPLNDVFTLKLQIAGGSVADNMYPLLADALNNAGTDSYSTSELKKAFATAGAVYEFNSGYYSFTLTVTGIDDAFDETIELVEHLLTKFSPTENTIDYLYNQRKTDNKISKSNPSTGGRMLYVYGLYGDRSNYLNRIPAKTLKNLDPNVLKSKLNELTSKGFTSIHYVGQKDQEQVLKTFQINPFFGKNDTDKYQFMEAEEVDNTTIYLVNDKKAIQSYVYYVVNGAPLNHKEYYKKEAFNSYYTNSLSGLLFQEVREFRSLAYATGGTYIDPKYEPEKKGRLVLFTGSQADKTVDAVEVVIGLLNDMPVYETRLPNIRDGLILKSSSSKPAFRELSSTVDTFLKSGFEEDPNKSRYSKYSELSFEDILTFYEQNIKNKPAMITIYGDASRFDIDRLKSFGKVVELDMKDIRVE